MADQVKHISSHQEFDNLLASNKYVIADFHADWCGPCKLINPHFSKMASTFSIPGFLAFAKVNVDHVQSVAQKYSVAAMPTFLFFKEGNQVAVNGQAMIQGANLPSLNLAVEKMGKLAKEKAAAAAAAAAE
ncbi:Patrx3 thioredoxin encoded by the PaTrx3 gene [Podospora comata]|uniref:Patrx3 thioredoxin encoded by the PaTrx3 protein n=1 Tax=Podospora comata TaxID=48703 RepID=A0ABY6SM35_PODCO|nr:Patrx3 thioredoxin encoded by the PaTrx3 gene [Podospora comata]